MKKISAFVLLAFACNLAFSQTDEDRKAAFQFSFFPPIGTNGLNYAKTTNTVSFNMLVGVSKNEKVFTLGGLSNIILNDAEGLQMAGLYNFVGNEGRGIQMAGLVNINKGAFSGLQLGGVVNTAAEVKGAQFAGLVNTALDVEGVQFAGLVNIAKDVDGAQFAGLVNTALDVEGVQFAGLVNVAKDVESSQFAGLVNTALDVKGVQFAGLVNVAKDVKGAQFAGIINIAENSDVPIGVINIIKNGEMGIAVTYDGMGSTVASFRSGGKYTYGILGVGYNHKINKDGFVLEAGLGAHIPITKCFRINNEIKSTTIVHFLDIAADKEVTNTGYSILPAFKIGQHFELFGGPSINYMVTKNMSAANVFSDQSIWKNYSDKKLQKVYIGYQVGMQFIF